MANTDIRADYSRLIFFNVKRLAFKLYVNYNTSLASNTCYD